MIDGVIYKRATPRQWANYSAANTVIHLVNTSNTRIANDLRSNLYIRKWQTPLKRYLYWQVNLQGWKAVFAQCMKKIDFDWISVNNPDNFRKLLKQTFIWL